MDGRSNSLAFFCEVRGNGYSNGTVDFMVSGYIYMIAAGSYSSYISTNASSAGTSYPSQVKAYCDSNGHLCLWFARVGYWQGFEVYCKNVQENTDTFNTYNHVTSVTDIAFPSNARYTTNISVTAH